MVQDAHSQQEAGEECGLGAVLGCNVASFVPEVSLPGGADRSLPVIAGTNLASPGRGSTWRCWPGAPLV